MKRFTEAVGRHIVWTDLFGALIWLSVFILAAVRGEGEAAFAWLLAAVLLIRIGSLEARLQPIDKVFRSPNVTLTVHTEKETN